MQAHDIPYGAQNKKGTRKGSKKLLGLSQGIYLLAIIFAITLMVSAAGLAFGIGKADGFELYAVSGLMVLAAVAVWVFGRAIYRLAR